MLSIVAAAFLPNRNLGATSEIKDAINTEIPAPNFETQVPVAPEAGENAAQ